MPMVGQFHQQGRHLGIESAHAGLLRYAIPRKHLTSHNQQDMSIFVVSAGPRQYIDWQGKQGQWKYLSGEKGRGWWPNVRFALWEVRSRKRTTDVTALGTLTACLLRAVLADFRAK